MQNLHPKVDADAADDPGRGPTEWPQLIALAGEVPLFIAADSKEALDGCDEYGLRGVALNLAEAPVYEKLTQAVLECVAEEILAPGSRVVAIYSGFEVGMIGLDQRDQLERALGAADLARCVRLKPTCHSKRSNRFIEARECTSLLEKVACRAFSDSGFVFGGEKRGFRHLHRQA